MEKKKFMNENHYVLEYDFHIYTINMECKKVERKRLYFDKVEELLEGYRNKKDALFMGCIKYNDNFKIYRAIFEEIDIKGIDMLM